MSKVTSRHRASIPKALAARAGLGVGDELEREPVAAGALRLRLAVPPRAALSVAERLRLFDAATARQATRERRRRVPGMRARGWRRDDLHAR